MTKEQKTSEVGDLKSEVGEWRSPAIPPNLITVQMNCGLMLLQLYPDESIHCTV